jgi:hypothetical protein
MFFQIIRQSLVYSLLNGTLYLAVTELGLGLSLKLRFSYLAGDNGGSASVGWFVGKTNLWRSRRNET